MVESASVMPDPLTLNLGCGNTYIEGAVNLDNNPKSRADVLHDLTRFPWPFPDNHFSEVRALDIIEHLPDTIRTMGELHRICRSGARLHVVVPHFSSSNNFWDPTHVRQFSARTFEIFTDEGDSTFHTPARFRILRRQIVFTPTLINKLVARLANRYAIRYEERFAWMFPAWFVSLELEAVKPPR